MSAISDLTYPFPMYNTRPGAYIWTCKFDTNNTDPPDGVVPGDGVTLDQTATGVYTITFAAANKPQELLYGTACFLGSEPQLQAKVVSYVLSTGVLTVEAYDEDDTSGISAKADSNNKTIQVLCVFTRNGLD